MGDAKRFLRYLMPGAFFVSHVVLCLYVLSPETLAAATAKLAEYTWGWADGGVAVTVFGGLVVAAIGYFLGLVHHLLLGHLWGEHWGFQDYRPFLGLACRRKLLRIETRDESLRSVLPERLNYDGAWRVVCALWREREKSPRIKKSHTRNEANADLMHGAGTTLVGTGVVFAAGLFFAVRLAVNPLAGGIWWPLVLGALVCLVPLLVAWFSFRRLVGQATGFLETILWNELRFAMEDPRSYENGRWVISVGKEDIA